MYNNINKKNLELDNITGIITFILPKKSLNFICAIKSWGIKGEFLSKI